MSKLWMGVSVFFLAFLFTVNSAWCETIKNRWGAGYRYRYVNADDDDMKTHGNSHNANLVYGLTDNFALELEGGYFGLKSKAGSKVGVYSAYLALQLRKDIKNFTPYVVGGLGFQGYDYNNVRSGDLKDSNSSISYKTGGGVEYFLNRNWAISTEAVYVYGNTGGDATLDVYGWQYGAGVKYYF